MAISVNKEKFVAAVQNNHSYQGICREMGWCLSGGSNLKCKKLIAKWGLSTEHFNPAKSLQRYERINKECPVCGKTFETLKGHKREKTVCSMGCSNTHFRSGKNNGNYKDPKDRQSLERHYRGVCFSHYEEKCLLCDWDISVDVHHIDENKENNSIGNLVPLCANHHRMAHMNQHKEFIQSEIKEKQKFT